MWHVGGRQMDLYDVKCKDVARFLATGPKTLDDIGSRIHELYPEIDPKGKWVKEVLVEWNPLIVKKNDKFELSVLGRALISLPGREGKDPTVEETIFLIGVMMLDERQRKVVGELITTGSSKHPDNWVVNRTRACLKQMRFL